MNIFDEIKKNVDLVQYLQNNGYEIDNKKSTKKWKILQNNTHKFLVFKPQNTDYLLFRDTESNKNGSIIDFIKNYQNKNLVEIAKEYSKSLTIKNINNNKINKNNKKSNLNKTNILETKKEKSTEIKLAYIFNVIENYKPQKIQEVDNYIKERNINPEILTQDRFKNTIKLNTKYNNIFIPHYEDTKLVGAEIIKKDEKRFFKNGKKTNYITNQLKTDTEIVITESFIDLVSYYNLHPEKIKNTIGIQTAGEISKITIKNLTRILNKKSNINKLIIATDNDERGKYFAQKIQQIVVESNYKKETTNLIKTDRYDLEKYKDMNEKLSRITTTKINL